MHFNHHFVGPVLEQLGDVKMKRGTCTDVGASQLTVDIDPSLVIDAAEMDPHPLAFHVRRHLKSATVPDILELLAIAQAQAR